MNDNDTPIIDGDIVGDSLPTDTTGQSTALVIMNLESIIKTHLSDLDKIQEQLEKHQGMLDDILNNDETYKKHTDLAKEAARVKSATKQQLLRQPQAADLGSKVKSFRSEIKELKGALSDYLREYQRLSGVNEIEGDDGEVREIVYTAKLIKKSFRP